MKRAPESLMHLIYWRGLVKIDRTVSKLRSLVCLIQTAGLNERVRNAGPIQRAGGSAEGC